MNRAVHLYRPAPTVVDLSLTAEGMVRSANLKGYLGALAKSYNEIYTNQEHAGKAINFLSYPSMRMCLF